jgi:filamentous hemagglutinin family protein
MISPSKYLKSLLILNAFAFKLLFASNLAVAQNIPVPDDTLGNENSRVESLGAIDAITGGATRGFNLFHSFREFNVDVGRGVYFFAPNAEIQNILTRVTGGNRSEILGKLGTIGGSQPNLFLINPNGIVFGKGASLDVGGSFVATTANAVQFGEQGVFSATNPEVPQLLRVNPSALFFNQINNTVAGDIRLNATGGITVADGSQIRNLVRQNSQGQGGNITIDTGSFQLRDGAALTASTFGEGNAGSVKITATDAVSLTNNAGILSRVEAGGVGKGGNIDIDAASLSLTDGAQLLTSTLGASGNQSPGKGDAGNVNVKVSGVIDIAGVKNGFSSAIFSRVGTGAEGNGGNITIGAGSLQLRDGAQLQASTLGQGNAGSVKITATDAVSLTGNVGILSTVEALGVGKGGNIDIDAASLSLTDGAQLQTITRGASDTQPPGKGDAGNVNVKVSGLVDIAGVKNGLSSGIFSRVETGTEGSGGNITIGAGSLQLRDGGQLSASTFGQGNAGSVKITATDAVFLTGGQTTIFSTVEAGGVGKGGNIDIDAASLSLTDGAQLQTSPRRASGNQPPGKGNAGNVNVKVSGVIDIAGVRNGLSSAIFSVVDTGAEGNGGNITIGAGSFQLRDGAKLEASTLGQGNAGSVKITATDAVSLTGGQTSIFSAVEAGGVGKGGNIDIYAASLSLTDGAQLLTSTRGASGNQPPGKGDAGNVNVKVSGTVDIAGKKDTFPSGIRSTVETGTVGNGGNITIGAGSFQLRDGAALTASTSGQGNAGSVKIIATDAVSLTDAGIFSAVEAGGVGKGGNIDIDAATLSLTDGAQLATSTLGQGNAGSVKITATDAVSLTDGRIFSTVEAGGVGKGGNIDIDAASLSLTDSAQLLTITRRASGNQSPGKGDAGNVNVKVSGVVDIAGVKNGFFSGISSLVSTGTEGNGGNINVDAGSLKLRNGGLLTASTSGQGNAGDISVTTQDFITISGRSSNFSSGLYVNSTSRTGKAGDVILKSPKITLDESGTLNSESASGNGGNINLTSNLLLLRRGGQITTNAGTAQLGGDGGNIGINSRFIVAIPKENSDITANAFTGTGGNVDITSRGVFGIEPRTQRTNESDITASSELGVTGNINLNTPDNSGIQNSLADLPNNQIDTNTLIASSCINRTADQNNTFFIVGKGGIPIRPDDAPLPNYSTGSIRSLGTTDSHRPWKIGDPVVEPTGVYQLPNGKLILSRECS